jgi:hypothetical protein
MAVIRNFIHSLQLAAAARPVEAFPLLVAVLVAVRVTVQLVPEFLGRVMQAPREAEPTAAAVVEARVKPVQRHREAAAVKAVMVRHQALLAHP